MTSLTNLQRQYSADSNSILLMTTNTIIFNLSNVNNNPSLVFNSYTELLNEFESNGFLVIGKFKTYPIRLLIKSSHLLFFTNYIPYKRYYISNQWTAEPVIANSWINSAGKSELIINWVLEGLHILYPTILESIIDMMTKYEKRCFNYEKRSKKELAKLTKEVELINKERNLNVNTGAN